MKQSFWIKKLGGFILMATVAILLFTFIVMTLWNNILTPVIGVRIISFGQALGILVLSRILFGGFRGGGWRGRTKSWNSGMKNKWQSMTAEEKEKFTHEWKSRCNRNYSFSNKDASPNADNTASG